jgi:hypothetical protein
MDILIFLLVPAFWFFIVIPREAVLICVYRNFPVLGLIVCMDEPEVSFANWNFGLRFSGELNN